LQGLGDPMGPGDTQTAAAPPSAATVLIQQEQAQRNDTNAWHERRDDNITGIRGRS